MDTLILALALTTGQDHLPTLYPPCCCYGQQGREEREPLYRGLGSGGRLMHPLPSLHRTSGVRTHAAGRAVEGSALGGFTEAAAGRAEGKAGS